MSGVLLGIRSRALREEDWKGSKAGKEMLGFQSGGGGLGGY